MQIDGKPTPAEINEASHIMRSKSIWARYLISQAYGILLLVAILWILISTLLSGKPIPWKGDGLLFAFLAAIVALSWVRIRRNKRRMQTALNHEFADAIQLETSGVKTESNNGANSFTPWSAFKGWRMGKQIALLNYAEGKRTLILPLSGLSAPEQQTLRGTIQSYLGPPSNRR